MFTHTKKLLHSTSLRHVHCCCFTHSLCAFCLHYLSIFILFRLQNLRFFNIYFCLLFCFCLIVGYCLFASAGGVNCMGIFNRMFWSNCRKFHGILTGFFLLVLLVGFFVYREGIFQISFSGLFHSQFRGNWSSRDSSDVNLNWSRIARRIIKEIPSNFPPVENENGIFNRILGVGRTQVICSGVYEHKGYSTKCQYLRANPECQSKGLFDYLMFFYCDCEKLSALGYIVLAIWLIALFYLLGNTATDYFCCCLEKLSNLLNLPPTVAGVTLLPLGNGAPDVFASIAAFTGSQSGDVGLNGVLGGAVFVTCIVVGTISLCVAKTNIRVDKRCFIRDVCFFLATVLALLVILIVGEVSVGGAIAFLSIYIVYAVYVASKEIERIYSCRLKLDSLSPLLPVKSDALTSNNTREHEFLEVPSLDSDSTDEVPNLQDKLSQRMWVSNVAVYSNDAVNVSFNEGEEQLWVWNEQGNMNEQSLFSCSNVCFLLELPLVLSRRLTIPIVDEERWSKVYAVSSASLAPVLLAFLLNRVDDAGPLAMEITYIVAAIVGCILGMLTFLYTEADHPPKRLLFMWVLGGFLMSITWFYIIATELVSLLVALGVIFGIKPSLLALTVLAWGNSMGDLTSNVAMAVNGRDDGVQIAISGCYAGPMFNTLCGLGISLLIGACSKRPAPYVVPLDPSLYFTLSFLILGLLWSLIVLPCNNMRPNKTLGVGLMAIYFVFLTFRVSLSYFSS